MILEPLLKPETTALIVIDIQNDYCSPKGRLPQFRKLDTTPIQEMIPKLGYFIDKARGYKVPVIWTQMIEDHRYVPNNLKVKMESFGQPFDLCTPGTWGHEFYQLQPKELDEIISKKQYGAFTNPKMDRLLREKKTESVIVTGVLASRCVRATVQNASERGYHVIVPKDLISAYKQQSHLMEATLEDIGIIYAHLTKSEDIIKIWSKI
jgi:ureidoacrylate peracid hydrolase